ncbi:MAG: sigma-70 family RNA polymerase sigma factor [Gemmatimonadaceae bacterium]
MSSDVSSKPEGENPKAHVVTGLLQAWGAGDASALDALFPIVYGELRQRASHVLGRESVGHTLQPTALVHEAYLRLVDQRVVRWEGRTQFFALAARVMRRVLVDHARARLAGKRGAGANHVTLIETALSSDASNGESIDSIDLLALDDALVRLAAFDARKARLVELRYFAGLSIPQAAESLGISQATVIREWSVARRWLHRELSE